MYVKVEAVNHVYVKLEAVNYVYVMLEAAHFVYVKLEVVKFVYVKLKAVNGQNSYLIPGSYVFLPQTIDKINKEYDFIMQV